LTANGYQVCLDLVDPAGVVCDGAAGDLIMADEQLPQGYTMTPATFSFNSRGVVTDIASEVVAQIDTPSGRQGFVRVNVLGRIGHTF
jgi:hypothetical protein